MEEKLTTSTYNINKIKSFFNMLIFFIGKECFKQENVFYVKIPRQCNSEELFGETKVDVLLSL